MLWQSDMKEKLKVMTVGNKVEKKQYSHSLKLVFKLLVLQKLYTAAKYFIDFVKNIMMACLSCLGIRMASCRLSQSHTCYLHFSGACLVDDVFSCVFTMFSHLVPWTQWEK